MDIIVDLGRAEDKNSMISRFIDALGLPAGPKSNWDSFYDDIRSLHTQSSVVIKKKPRSIHLIIKNSKHIEDEARAEYQNLLEVLTAATDKDQRYDDLVFSFELIKI